jgi:hypothetical protein
MTIEVRKYVPKDAHPLAPFWLHVAAPDVKAALAELEVALSDIKELSKPKEEAKPAKVIKNPRHCEHVKDIIKTKTGNYYFVRCSEYDEAGMLIPAGLIDNDVDVKECFECKSFKAKEVK